MRYVPHHHMFPIFIFRCHSISEVDRITVESLQVSWTLKNFGVFIDVWLFFYIFCDTTIFISAFLVLFSSSGRQVCHPYIIFILRSLDEVRSNHYELSVFQDLVPVFCVIELEQNDFKFAKSSLFFVWYKVLYWYMSHSWTEILKLFFTMTAFDIRQLCILIVKCTNLYDFSAICHYCILSKFHVIVLVLTVLTYVYCLSSNLRLSWHPLLFFELLILVFRVLTFVFLDLISWTLVL